MMYKKRALETKVRKSRSDHSAKADFYELSLCVCHLPQLSLSVTFTCLFHVLATEPR